MGHNPFAPATEQCEWRHRRTPGTDFHHRTLSHRCRSGRYIHGDAPQSAEAKSDGANMLPLSEARALLEQLTKLRMAVNIL